ncbi:MAG: hypothetical protein EOP52_04260 [Sphingobacteriales bacterium]|nr:MAG: hypothetical protein EOP52_04260 [Sphingobacteriales bacterium]
MDRLFLFLLLLPFGSYAGGVPLVTTPMIERLNPASFKTDFSTYDQPTAVFCAQLSDCAYMAAGDYPLLERSLNERYGAGTFSILNVESNETATRAMVCATDRFVVVAFRGTEGNKDNLLTDLKIRLFVNSDSVDSILRHIPGGHAGFRNGAAELIKNQGLFDTIRQEMTRRSIQVPVYLTGHSMGAAYSSILIRSVAEQFSFGGAYQFAPPLTIYCPDAEIVRKRYGNLVYDIVNYKDQVALGTPYLQRYMQHIGTFLRFSDSGILHRETEYYVGWTAKEFSINRLMVTHAMETYLQRLQSPLNSTEQVAHRYRKGETVFDTKGLKPIRCEKCNDRKLKYGFTLIPAK